MLKLLGQCLCLLSAWGFVFGQSAELSGLVEDPSGSAIAHAQVELRNQDTGVRFRSNSNLDGIYNFRNLRPGTYCVTVQAEFFRTLTRNAIVLDVGDRLNLDFSLQLAGTASSIVVNAAPPPHGLEFHRWSGGRSDRRPVRQ
jgi:Carboxypeptidase regulatory-like domain